MSRTRRHGRNVARALALALPLGLLALLVGCGGNPEQKEAKQPAVAVEKNKEVSPWASQGGGGQPGGGSSRGGSTRGYLQEHSPIPEGPGVSYQGALGSGLHLPTNNDQNAEAYSHIADNDYRAVSTAPLSTFSADVNTASYSNVRRFLNEGKLPPKDAVFLADMLNYFPYQYPYPSGQDPISLTLDIAACPWKAEHKLVRIGVRARTVSPGELPQRNLVFLIDTSGSMSVENKLPLVKQSIEMLLPQLTAADRVSIVTYAGTAGVALEPTAGNETEAIRKVIDGLGAGGSTNGAGGITAAYDLARKAFIDGGANRVVLCTDGDFNVGVNSESDLVQLIEKERESKVFLTVLGYGMGNLKYGNLEKLARHGNGHYAYIDGEREARKVFVEQGGALVCVSKDVKFQVEFNPARVGAYRLIGYENRLLKNEDFKDDKKDAGDMGSGHTVTALYEVVPAGVKFDVPGVDPLKYQTPAKPTGGSDEWLTVKMRYKQPEGETSTEFAGVLDGKAKEEMGDDFRFAAAVAEFGQVLRDSPHKGESSYDGALKRAKEATGGTKFDPNGHRAEFVKLVEAAKGIKK